MNLTEKMAYLKGLADGMKLDESKDEVKLIKKLIEAVSEVAETLEEVQDYADELADQIDAVDEDLAELEEDFYEDECDCCDDDCDCDDCDDYIDDEDELYYEVTCDNCGETICVTEDVLLCGEINCPKCDELLEFDFSDLVDCEDCDCEDCKADEE